jgi:uncharacterized protein YbaR (Trm112 family)
MRREPKSGFLFDTMLLEQLACPACRGELCLEGAPAGGMHLVCVGCRSAYPVVDGIPVLIAGRTQSAGA